MKLNTVQSDRRIAGCVSLTGNVSEGISPEASEGVRSRQTQKPVPGKGVGTTYDG
jgi:hypothetical protein